jgi:predicted site-specific integrase-resolvase
MTEETRIYDLKDLEKKLDISIMTLREYIKRGELKASMIGRAYYVTEPNLMRFMGGRGANYTPRKRIRQRKGEVSGRPTSIRG